MCGTHRRGPHPQATRASTERRDPDLLVSDSDRRRVVDSLTAHTAEGRLDLVEFESRVDEAWRASTQRELDDVLRHLPRTSPDEPRPGIVQRVLALPTPVLLVALVAGASLAFGHFAWWVLPIWFCLGGVGCGSARHREREDDRIAVST